MGVIIPQSKMDWSLRLLKPLGNNSVDYSSLYCPRVSPISWAPGSHSNDMFINTCVIGLPYLLSPASYLFRYSWNYLSNKPTCTQILIWVSASQRIQAKKYLSLMRIFQWLLILIMIYISESYDWYGRLLTIFTGKSRSWRQNWKFLQLLT